MRGRHYITVAFRISELCNVNISECFLSAINLCPEF